MKALRWRMVYDYSVTGNYVDVYAWDNLYTAYRLAARGKRGRPATATFEYRLEDNLVRLQDELAAGPIDPGPYASFLIHEPRATVDQRHAVPIGWCTMRYASRRAGLRGELHPALVRQPGRQGYAPLPGAVPGVGQALRLRPAM